MTGITRQQRNALDFIAAYTGKNGFAPSYGEIAAAVGVKSKGRVADLVKGLAERGHIRWLPNRPRSIEIIDATAEAHLRTVLQQFDTNGTVSSYNRAVIDARQYLAGRAA